MISIVLLYYERTKQCQNVYQANMTSLKLVKEYFFIKRNVLTFINLNFVFINLEKCFDGYGKKLFGVKNGELFGSQIRHEYKLIQCFNYYY